MGISEFLDFAQANVVLVGIFLVLLAIIISTEARRFTQSYQDVDPDEAVRLINRENAALLDLREDSERVGGTIRNARHVAVSTLDQHLDELKPLKDTPLVAFCASGVRAPAACRLLKKHGFSKVYNLKGGLTAWQQANMPVVKK